jgi:hypothetical protein
MVAIPKKIRRGFMITALFLDDQLHVHVVVSTPALHGALDRVLPRIRRSFDLIVMSAFVKTEVPPLVAKTADHQAVNRAIAGQLRSMLRCNSQPQHFAGVSPDYGRLRIGYTKRVVARRNDLDDPPLRQVGPDGNAAQQEQEQASNSSHRFTF